MCASRAVSALRTLNLSRNATQDEVKGAFRKLAKKWHPDKHQGASKKQAEENFKEVQQAYEFLSTGGLREASAGPSGAGYRGSHTGMRGERAGDPSFKQQQWWGEHYGPASRPGYNPYGPGGGGYMGFGGPDGNSHFYEDTAAAAAKQDESRRWRSWISVALFGAGLYAVSYTGSRDKAAKARGELVDAWWNQTARRWERPPAHFKKDPMLSALIHLKPPSIVHNATSHKPNPRKQAVTIDGVRAKDSYRAREQGHRT